MANKILEKTVDLMLSDDYELRFIAEYRQAVNRRNRLKKVIAAAKKGELDFTLMSPIDLLERQCSAMSAYISAMKERAEIEHINLSYRG